jgi:hypothetical protein
MIVSENIDAGKNIKKFMREKNIINIFQVEISMREPSI